MSSASFKSQQIQEVTSFQELVATPFQGAVNALCWSRKLYGDFEEIVGKLSSKENIIEVDESMLLKLELSEAGQLAREILLTDLSNLKYHGAAPSLNIINAYEKDESFFPTDDYSFNVDRSPLPTATYLCTYYGSSSEIVSNDEAQQKILLPEIRQQLKKIYEGDDVNFESFLSEYFFDLHYQANANANLVTLGLGQLWKIAVDHPESEVLPCIHRAPIEKEGEARLLLIC